MALHYRFHVYILRCADDSFYVGHTDDLDKRLSQHQLGVFDGYTKSRRPVRLAYAEEYLTRDDAFVRERQIKGWSRAKKEALIRADWQALEHLSMERTGLRRLRFDDWATDTEVPGSRGSTSLEAPSQDGLLRALTEEESGRH